MANPISRSDSRLSLPPPEKTPKHTKEPARYKCTQCEQSFTRSATRRDHIRREHTKERSFKCNLDSSCDKAFATERDLKRHELSSLHTKERKFICQGSSYIISTWQPVKWGCGTKFARKDNLMAHLRLYPKTPCLAAVQRHMNTKFQSAFTTNVAWNLFNGRWTCQYRNPWKLAKEGERATGYGQQFQSKLSLGQHFFGRPFYNCFGGGAKKQSPCEQQVLLNGAQRAIEFAHQELERQRESDVHPGKDKARDKAVRYRVCPFILGRPISIWAEIPVPTDPGKAFELCTNGHRVRNFMWDREVENVAWLPDDGIKYDVYCLTFHPPEFETSFQITLTTNLIGDLNGYTFDMISFKVDQTSRGAIDKSMDAPYGLISAIPFSTTTYESFTKKFTYGASWKV
ncbi:hypothetical protein VTL71DRAFT_13854 [Oculimacula yallundae]|uniref:C2H2 type master regulator of conidiophore development brlA n=1 Tax=Oculimacula yallundae TaxID=86028 RepID=A0ABR4CLK8_9HELO